MATEVEKSEKETEKPVFYAESSSPGKTNALPISVEHTSHHFSEGSEEDDYLVEEEESEFGHTEALDTPKAGEQIPNPIMARETLTFRKIRITDLDTKLQTMFHNMKYDM